MFSKFVKLLYPLRKNEIIKDRVKSFLRCLWGALSQRNIFKKVYKMDVETELFDCEIVEMIPHNDDSYKITYMKSNRPYETKGPKKYHKLCFKAKRLSLSAFCLELKGRF
jgi:hypothetical protein